MLARGFPRPRNSRRAHAIRRAAWRRLLALGIALLAVVGCRAVLLPEGATIPLADVRPDEALEVARAALPQRFTVLNAVVLKKFGKSISTLGYTTVDEPADSITVAILSPAGVKLLEASQVAGREDVRYVADPLAELGDVAEVVLRDIRRMYFDRLPAPGSAWKRKGERLVFSQGAGNTRLEYIFAGTPALPIRKESFEGRRKTWVVSYQDHEWHGAYLFPRTMVLEDEKQGYELLVRLLEVTSTDGAGS